MIINQKRENMKNEFLDIVDEDNNLIGKKELRSVVHSSGLFHRTVHVYLFKKIENKIYFLVHLRSKEKDLSPNCWDLRFGGHIKSGEPTHDALVSEMQEELGLDVKKLNIIESGWLKSENHPNCEFNKVYFLEFNDELSTLSFNDNEVEEVRWLSTDEIIVFLEKSPTKWTVDIKEFEVVLHKLKKALGE